MHTHQTLLVGLDFTLLDNLLIRRAGQMAHLLHIHKLIVVHIIDDADVPATLLADFKVIHEEAEQQARKQLVYEVEDNLPEQADTWIEVDETEEYIIKAKDLHSKCSWTPFEDFDVRGRLKKVVLRGKIAYEDRKVLINPGYGKNIRG